MAAGIARVSASGRLLDRVPGSRNGGAAPLPSRLWQAWKLRRRGDLEQSGLDPSRQLERLGVLLKMADGICPADRIGLAEHVVGQVDLGVRIAATDLAERGGGAAAGVVHADPEQARYILIALAALAK